MEASETEQKRAQEAEEMSKTKHPADGCSKAQREAFDRICIGDDAGINERTAQALINRGLIQADEQRLTGRFPVRIMRYSVSIPVHMQWCQWCREQPS